MQRKSGEATGRGGDKSQERCRRKDEERESADDLKAGLTRGWTGARQASFLTLSRCDMPRPVTPVVRPLRGRRVGLMFGLSIQTCSQSPLPLFTPALLLDLVLSSSSRSCFACCFYSLPRSSTCPDARSRRLAPMVERAPAPSYALAC